MNNGLIIIIGESFRGGGQGCRLRGQQESYDDQYLASSTQIKIIKQIKEEVNNIDVKLFTYDTQYNQNIIDWYSELNTQFLFYKDPIGYDNIFKNSISEIDKDYDFILVFRVDLVFKFNFFNLIKKDKINYTSVCWIKSFLNPEYNLYSHNKTPLNKKRVVDALVYVPNKFLNNLKSGEITLLHEACDIMSDYIYSNVDFILDTYHDSDSQKDKNPIYRIANRPETEIWYSDGYRLGDEPIPDNSKNYGEVFKNIIF